MKQKLEDLNYLISRHIIKQEQSRQGGIQLNINQWNRIENEEIHAYILNRSVKVIQWEKNSLNMYTEKKLNPYFIKYTKINSKWKRSKIITLLKEEIGEIFCHLVVSRFLSQNTQH